LVVALEADDACAPTVAIQVWSLPMPSTVLHVICVLATDTAQLVAVYAPLLYVAVMVLVPATGPKFVPVIVTTQGLAEDEPAVQVAWP
jgi:hypothetical protein